MSELGQTRKTSIQGSNACLHCGLSSGMFSAGRFARTIFQPVE
jgi:hypothetical protein